VENDSRSKRSEDAGVACEKAFARRRSGIRTFSLIELLVVISIISVLAALLMPALQSAKDSARTVQCMNNLHQIAIAVALYGDERGHYPWSFEGGTDWSYTITPYFQGSNNLAYGSYQHNLRSTIIQCPARAYKPTNIVSSYGMHERVAGNKADINMRDPPTYPRLYPFTQRPAEVFLVADATQDSTILGGEARAGIFAYGMQIEYADATAEIVMNMAPNDDFIVRRIRFRHRFNTAANALFLDGHVAPLKANDVRRKNLYINNP
jgi:prepilin-type N-terminal cleavage/methylation domain-containing protein/prepilin-type processing-associated H-X9-DG protein